MQMCRRNKCDTITVSDLLKLWKIKNQKTDSGTKRDTFF